MNYGEPEGIWKETVVADLKYDFGIHLKSWEKSQVSRSVQLMIRPGFKQGASTICQNAELNCRNNYILG
jgi:hypothetical protein